MEWATFICHCDFVSYCNAFRTTSWSMSWVLHILQITTLLQHTKGNIFPHLWDGQRQNTLTVKMWSFPWPRVMFTLLEPSSSRSVALMILDASLENLADPYWPWTLLWVQIRKQGFYSNIERKQTFTIAWCSYHRPSLVIHGKMLVSPRKSPICRWSATLLSNGSRASHHIGLCEELTSTCSFLCLKLLHPFLNTDCSHYYGLHGVMATGVVFLATRGPVIIILDDIHIALLKNKFQSIVIFVCILHNFLRICSFEILAWYTKSWLLLSSHYLLDILVYVNDVLLISMTLLLVRPGSQVWLATATSTTKNLLFQRFSGPYFWT